MGVYHLMGLGLSPGTVIGPLTYLAHRYQRWNENDQMFFARSGEARQRKTGARVGDVQAIVLFTTREVLTGEISAFDYVDNPPGDITKGPQKPRRPMKEVLRSLLRREWPRISGGRPEGTIFWCEVDRRNILTTYERVIQVVASLSQVGGQGKEIWANLTGGNNVINFALQLSATLSGEVARLYYVQAENAEAERCVRFTAENGYWVELPVLPLSLSELHRTIIDLLTEEGTLTLKDLFSILHSRYWNLSQGISSEDVLRDQYLKPLWKQGLVAEEEAQYILGPQWDLIRPYLERWEQAKQQAVALEILARQKSWLEFEQIPLR